MVFISFPGLGIDEFSLNRVAFSVGRLEVRWYGIIIVLGIITAFLYAHMRSKEFGVPLTINDLKENATVEALEKLIGEKEAPETYEILSDYPLSETQNGILVECISKPESTVYNIPYLFKLSDKQTHGQGTRKQCVQYRRRTP